MVTDSSATAAEVSSPAVTIHGGERNVTLPLPRINQAAWSYSATPVRYIGLLTVVLTAMSLHATVAFEWFRTTQAGTALGLTYLIVSLLLFTYTRRTGRPCLTITTANGRQHVVYFTTRAELDDAVARLPDEVTLSTST